MKKEDLCPGKAATVLIARNPELSIEAGYRRPNPDMPIKRIKMLCELCKRKVLSSVEVSHDGLIFHSIPPHKPKGWWKKKSLRRTKGK
jgi:hypothetical protein